MVENNRRNHYRILHVQPDAPLAVIKSSYRALMLSLQMHPDYGGDHWNASLINEAYEVLSNPSRREEYDRQTPVLTPRGASQSEHRPAGPASRDPIRCVFCGARATARLALGNRCARCRSPLVTPEKLEAGGSGKRLIDRVPLRARLEYYTTWPQRRSHVGLLEDLSPNGIRFAGDQAVNEHSILKIDSALISATARVAYCRGGLGWGEMPCEIGAEFFTLEFLNPAGTFLSTRA